MTAADRPSVTDWLTADAAGAARRARMRRETAVTDLFLPGEGRLRDDDRGVIARLLGGLIDNAERALRGHLAAAFADRDMLAESLASSRIAIAGPILRRSTALRDAPLIAALAQRAEEGRLITRLRLARDRALELDPDPEPAFLDALARDADPTIGQATARFVAAGRSRRDALGAPVLGPAELPAEVQHRLVWRVAAAVREYIVASHAVEPAVVDPALSRAAEAVLAGYDEGETLASLALALARALHEADRLDDAFAVRAVAAAEPGLAAAALAVRSGIGFEPAWEMMTDPPAGRLLLLCRAAGMAADHAADLAVRLMTGDDDEAMADRIHAYGALAPHRASSALTLWRLDPTYLDAIVELSWGRER